MVNYANVFRLTVNSDLSEVVFRFGQTFSTPDEHSESETVSEVIMPGPLAKELATKLLGFFEGNSEQTE